MEVPLTRSHWEAVELAPSVSLARGWEKQLEERYDSVLLKAGLTASSYRAWLDEQAVAYVALPDVPLDSSSAQEGRLIRRGLAYLRLVFASRHWRVYAVRDATPLLSGPGRLTALGSESFALKASAAGNAAGAGALHAVRHGRLRPGLRDECAWGLDVRDARAPGKIVVAAQFSVGRALGGWALRARVELPGRQSIQTRIAGQIDVDSVADDRVERARVHLEEDAAGGDAQAIGAVAGEVGEVDDAPDDRGRAGDAPSGMKRQSIAPVRALMA